MKYERMAIEIESPEEYGYDKIKNDLSESSVTDQSIKSLGLQIPDLTLLYNEHRGSSELREAIVQGSGLHKDDVLVTSGAAGALFIISTSQLTQDDHLVVVRPNYATNLETPKAIGCEVTHIDLQFESAWEINISHVADAIKSNTKIVSVTCPHNPTGTMMSRETLNQLVELTKSRGCLLLVDETYRDIHYKDQLPLAASLGHHVISVASMSKSYGTPGIRCGWIITQDRSLQQTFLAAKEQISISGSVIDEWIAEQLLNRKQIDLSRTIEEMKYRIDVVADWIDQDELLDWVRPTGGVVCLVKILVEPTGGTAAFYDRLLHEHSTYVGAGHWFGLSDTFFRLGFGWSTREQLQAGMKAISSAIRG